MDERLIRRIEREAGLSGLLDALTSLPATDLQSLLLAVYEQRATALTPSDVLRQYEENRFVAPSTTVSRKFHELDALALSLLDERYEWLDLSPVAPLGATAALGDLDQTRMVSTIRNTEVASDPTNVMALEAALRRRRNDAIVRLATSQRVVRGQTFDHPLARQHFRLIALCSAGRDRGHHAFEFEALLEHLRFYLRFLAQAADIGVRATTQRVLLSAFSGDALVPILEREVSEPLRAEFEIEVGFDQDREAARNYYDDIAFSVEVRGPEHELAIVDGGFVMWTQKLLGNNKERLLISGVGTELLASL
ncbi:MAG: hypothetical protein ACRDKT_17835 [Actinomycetota bacterium]